MPQAWSLPGDEGISEPYFFITHYAQTGRLAEVPLPDEARLHTEGWTGIVLGYAAFRHAPDPESLLMGLWQAAWAMAASTEEAHP